MRAPRELSRSIRMLSVRTDTLPPATHTNSYALGTREVLLVEPCAKGMREREQWIAWARSLVSPRGGPVACVLTHHHGDHAGALREILGDLKLPLWAHAETASRVDFPVARVLHDGETLRLGPHDDEVWTILHTPGHASGHLCFHCPASRSLVCGDMVASVGTILIEPCDGDMARYLAEVLRLRDLGADLVLPAHGEPISGDSDPFGRVHRHRLLREAKVLEVLRRGPIKLEALLVRVYDDVSFMTLPLARQSLLAHLQKLEDERLVRLVRGEYTCCF